MNYSSLKGFLFVLLPVLATVSCVDLNSDSERRQQEEQQITNYIKTNNITVQPSASGLYYIPETVGTGDTPGDNDFVVVRYKGWTLDGQLFDSTDSADVQSGTILPWFKLSGPFKFSMKFNLPGWVETFKDMKAGGKAIAIMPSILTINDYIPRKYEFQLLEVIHNISAYERQKIDTFVVHHEKAIGDSTSSGIYYIETLTGTGSMPTSTSVVSVQYTGKLIDGRIFEQTATGKNLSFNIGGNQVLPGFEEAVLKMKVGGKATVVLPYYKAYGESAKVNSLNQIVIPWYSTLVFDIQLISVQ